MWVGVGVLLGLVVVASVLGFHVGPHGHLAAFGLGVAAAIWLIVMAATGQSATAALGAARGRRRHLGRPGGDRLAGAQAPADRT